MIESVISLLIYVCILALVIYLVIFVVRDVLGVPIPPRVVQIIWVIVALIVVLMLLQAISAGGRFPKVTW